MQIRWIGGGLALGIALTSAPGTAAAQTPADADRSTMSGVYAADQATRGEVAYGSLCSGCHGAEMLEASFGRKWSGQPLLDLFNRIKNDMPENDPGVLSPAEAADIVAYILKMQGAPAGSEALSTTPAALGAIRIEAATPAS